MFCADARGWLQAVESGASRVPMDLPDPPPKLDGIEATPGS